MNKKVQYAFNNSKSLTQPGLIICLFGCVLTNSLLRDIQGCSANSYGANSYDMANSYGFLGKKLNSFTVNFSTFYRLPTRKFK